MHVHNGNVLDVKSQLLDVEAYMRYAIWINRDASIE